MVFSAALWTHTIRNAAQLHPGTIPYSSAKQRWLQGLLLPPGMPQKSVGRNLTRRRNRAQVRYGEPPLCQYCNPIPLIVWKWCSYTQPTYSVRSCAPGPGKLRQSKKKERNYACGHDCYRSQQHRTVALGPRKACHNTYEKAINSCGGVDIVLESSSAEYRHSRQFSHTPVYPGLYPQRPIEAIILPAKSYLAPLFSYIAPLMSSKARRRRPVALYHSLPPLPCPQPPPPPSPCPSQQRRRSRRRLGRLGCTSAAV